MLLLSITFFFNSRLKLIFRSAQDPHQFVRMLKGSPLLGFSPLDHTGDTVPIVPVTSINTYDVAVQLNLLSGKSNVY